MKILFQQNILTRPVSGGLNITNKNISFQRACRPVDEFVRSSEDFAELLELLNKETFEHRYGTDDNEHKIIKKAVPSMAKPQFTEKDYASLTRRERLILDNLINKGENVSTYTRRDYRISKDAERVLYYAKNTKDYLDKKYPNGYKLVSVGNSASPFVETMGLLGADTVVMPFSRTLLRGDFPFIKKQTEVGQAPMRYTKQNWVDYFKHFGVTSDFTEKTGKQLIFTDYSASGFTVFMYIKPLLENLGLKENSEFIDTLTLLNNATEGKTPNKKLGRFDLESVIDHASYKKFSTTKSAKDMDFDPFLNPELIDMEEQPFESKLFRYALWKQLEPMAYCF